MHPPIEGAAWIPCEKDEKPLVILMLVKQSWLLSSIRKKDSKNSNEQQVKEKRKKRERERENNRCARSKRLEF